VKNFISSICSFIQEFISSSTCSSGILPVKCTEHYVFSRSTEHSDRFFFRRINKIGAVAWPRRVFGVAASQSATEIERANTHTHAHAHERMYEVIQE